MQEAMKFLEEEMQIEAVEFVEKNDLGLIFTGFTEGKEEEIEVVLTPTNEVYLDRVRAHVYLPFNVWSLISEMEEAV